MKRKPLFPGKDAKNQLVLIMNQLGLPPESLNKQVEDKRIISFLEALAVDGHDHSPQDWSRLIKRTDDNHVAIDLLTQLLHMDPDQRLTASVRVWRKRRVYSRRGAREGYVLFVLRLYAVILLCSGIERQSAGTNGVGWERRVRLRPASCLSSLERVPALERDQLKL